MTVTGPEAAGSEDTVTETRSTQGIMIAAAAKLERSKLFYFSILSVLFKYSLRT